MMYGDLSEDANNLLGKSLKQIANRLVLTLEDLIILFNEKISTTEVKGKVTEIKELIDEFRIELDKHIHNLDDDTKDYVTSIEKYNNNFIDDVMTAWMIDEQVDSSEVIHEMCYKIRELTKKLG